MIWSYGVDRSMLVTASGDEKGMWLLFVGVWNNKSRPFVLYCDSCTKTMQLFLNAVYTYNVYHQWYVSVTTKLPIFAGLGRQSGKVLEEAHCWRDIIYLPVSHQLQ